MTWAGASLQPVRSAESLAEVSAILWHSGRGNKKEKKNVICKMMVAKSKVIIIHNAVFQEGFISLGSGRAEICKATSLYFSILEDED